MILWIKIFSLVLVLGLLVLFYQTIPCESQILLKDGSPIARTSDGSFRGKILLSRASREYYSFRGIQYATQRRFEVAEPIGEFTEVRDALEFGSKCPRVSLYFGELLLASEDCLFLNVYVPKMCSEENCNLLPVMVWIHAGAFMDQAGSELGADYFMDEDVILVTINYRLGALGFLNMDDGIIPSNLGLKDMILALKFLQKNIKGFGGDPEKVTIFGESAGGISVHLLMLSPAAKGLFRGVIAQGGIALSPWSITLDSKKLAKSVAKSCNCPSEDSNDVANCLRTMDLTTILKSQRDITHQNPDSPRPVFAPSIESNLPRILTQKSDFVVLPASPYELIVDTQYNNSRDVPLIVGGSDADGLSVMAFSFVLSEEKMKKLNSNWSEQTIKTFFYLSFVPEEKQEEFTNEFRSIYYGKEAVTSSNGHLLTRLHTESNFVRGAALAADLHSATNSHVYPYNFKYQGEFTLINLIPRHGVSHEEDLQYLFPSLVERQRWPYLKPYSRDGEFSKKLVKLWASFAINGEPTSSWGDLWQPVPSSISVAESSVGLRRISWLHLEESPILVEQSDEDWNRLNKLNQLFAKYEKPRLCRQGGDVREENIQD